MAVCWKGTVAGLLLEFLCYCSAGGKRFAWEWGTYNPVCPVSKYIEMDGLHCSQAMSCTSKVLWFICSCVAFILLRGICPRALQTGAIEVCGGIQLNGLEISVCEDFLWHHLIFGNLKSISFSSSAITPMKLIWFQLMICIRSIQVSCTNQEDRYSASTGVYSLRLHHNHDFCCQFHC